MTVNILYEIYFTNVQTKSILTDKHQVQISNQSFDLAFPTTLSK